jgi:hypothetical protein
MNRIARPRDPIRDDMLAVLDARLRSCAREACARPSPPAELAPQAGRAYISGTLTQAG